MAIAGSVAAQGYPAKTIRWIVPWPPLGGADALSRTPSPHLSESLKQQIIIDNRGGAAGNIGAEIVAKSPPDGYTVLFQSASLPSTRPSTQADYNARATWRPS